MGNLPPSERQDRPEDSDTFEQRNRFILEKIESGQHDTVESLLGVFVERYPVKQQTAIAAIRRSVRALRDCNLITAENDTRSPHYTPAASRKIIDLQITELGRSALATPAIETGSSDGPAQITGNEIYAESVDPSAVLLRCSRKISARALLSIFSEQQRSISISEAVLNVKRTCKTFSKKGLDEEIANGTVQKLEGEMIGIPDDLLTLCVFLRRNRGVAANRLIDEFIKLNQNK